MLPPTRAKSGADFYHVHLTGICGTGMAALAGMLKARGFRVTGSDVGVYPPMSHFLEKLGICVTRGYSGSNLEPKPDLVVIGNALSRGNPEVEEILDRKIPYASLPEIIKEWFLSGTETVVVAGTHGKTTTASLLAWILEDAGAEPSFLIGGIAGNFGSNFKLGQGKIFIVEGDEYDSAFFDKKSKFLHYSPQQVILNPIEYDHADIYDDLDSVLTAFRRLVNLVPRSGRIVAAGDNSNVRDCVTGAFCPVEFFGFEDQVSCRAIGLHTTQDGTRYELINDGKNLGEFMIPMAGNFNVANSIAAVRIALGLGISIRSIRKGLLGFRGISRRQQVRGITAGVTVIDDFAHHPTAIAATLQAIKALYPKRCVWAVVEPRSNTLRRKIFQKELESSFRDADWIIFSSVHRKNALEPSNRLDLVALVKSLRLQGKKAEALSGAQGIVDYLIPKLGRGDIVVVMSNGSFDSIHELLLQALQDRENNVDAGKILHVKKSQI